MWNSSSCAFLTNLSQIVPSWDVSINFFYVRRHDFVPQGQMSYVRFICPGESLLKFQASSEIIDTSDPYGGKKKKICVMWIRHGTSQLFHYSLAKTLKEMVPWFILMGRKFEILIKIWTLSLLAIQISIKEHKKKRKDHITITWFYHECILALYVLWPWVMSDLRQHNHIFQAS